MADCTSKQIEFEPFKRRRVELNFDGGDVSSDGGVLLLRKLDRRLGLLEAVAQKLADPRDPERIDHTLSDMLRQRVLGLVQGYEDLNDHASLRHDPLMQTACERDTALASAPTLCRLENRASRAAAWAIHAVMLEKFIASFKTAPEELVLDFDATDDPLYGKQEGRFFHGYYAEEIEQIHKRYDRFVLVNTNFGWNNHFLRAFRLDQPAGRPKNASEAGLAVYRTAQFENFQQMLPALARAFPDYTILIRPHPTEYHEVWREIAKDLPNARVANDGNVVPWLMACEALIHVGCTTAVEAAVIGKPAIAYQTALSEEFEPPLSYQLSLHAVSLEELLEKTRAAITGGLGVTGVEKQRILTRNIAALDGPLASECMLGALEGMGYAKRHPEPSGVFRYARGWIENQARTARKQINMRRRGHRNSTEYHDHRYPGVTLEGMQARVARLRDQLARFHGIRVRQISEHIFRVEG